VRQAQLVGRALLALLAAVLLPKLARLALRLSAGAA
jgi:hypothetical protein